jgi:hypothetical protein
LTGIPSTVGFRPQLIIVSGLSVGIPSIVGFRACLAQLQATPDPKNQLHSKFFLPNTPSFSSSTADLLPKKVGAKPQIHGFGGVPLEVLHKTKFGGVGRNYPPLPLISGKKTVRFYSPYTHPVVTPLTAALPHAGEATPSTPARLHPPALRRRGPARRPQTLAARVLLGGIAKAGPSMRSVRSTPPPLRPCP